MDFAEMKKFCAAIDGPVSKSYLGEENWSAYLDEKRAVHYIMRGDTQVGFWLQKKEGHICYYSSKAGANSSKICFSKEVPGPLHRHDFLELGYVIEGNAVQLFSGQEYIFPTGSFWLSDRSCIHQDVYQKKDLFTVFFSFNNMLFDNTFMNLIENNELRVFFQNALIEQKRMRQFISFLPRPDSSGAEVKCIVGQMADEVMAKRPGWKLVLRGLLVRLLTMLLEQYGVELTNQKKMFSSQAVYSEIAAYIKEHYADVTLQGLSEYYHYTSDSLSRLLKDNCGLSYSEYVQWVRVEKACELLENTSDTIDRIMEKVGYHNKRFFYSIFEKQVQMTPREYRRLKCKK